MEARELNRVREAPTVLPEDRGPPPSSPPVERRSKAAQLAALLERHRGERHIIVIQSYPDPDAISSALAHQMLSARFEISSDIAYDGVISHHENIAMVELLGITLLRVRDDDDLKRYQGSVFIDTQGTTTGLTGRLDTAGVPVVGIVDHHEPQGVVTAEHTDIRPDCSATATIYTEYVRELIELDTADDDHRRLATALMHGIRSETNALVRAQAHDFEAGAYLADLLDHDALDSILSVQRSRNTMEAIRAALGTRTVRDSYSIAGVGYLRHEDRDAIPQAADFLLTEENVHTAIVYGLVAGPDEDEAIIGSLRTKKATFNPDQFLKEALGGEGPGHFYGGGRREAGGFEIPVGFLAGYAGEEYRSRKWRLFDEQISRKLWTKLGVEDYRPPPKE